MSSKALSPSIQRVLIVGLSAALLACGLKGQLTVLPKGEVAPPPDLRTTPAASVLVGEGGKTTIIQTPSSETTPK